MRGWLYRRFATWLTNGMRHFDELIIEPTEPATPEGKK